MSGRRAALTLVTLAGLLTCLVCGHYVLADWARLNAAYARFSHLSSAGADLRTLFVADAVQNVHRIIGSTVSPMGWAVCSVPSSLLSASMASVSCRHDLRKIIMPDAESDLVLDLVRELVAAPGPPGQEEAIRALVLEHVEAIGCVHTTDARGNVLVAPPGVEAVPDRADIVVMAHLDEIALMVVQVEGDGRLQVTNLGGAYPWKWGEGPVTILAAEEALTGILSFGSIHTNAPGSVAVRARSDALAWDDTRVFTGLTAGELKARGVRPGTRVALHPSRRGVTTFGEFVSAPFLDDRADLAAWLLTLEALKDRPLTRPDSVVFAATVAEEVGGHGALYLLRRLQPEVGIALEVGPRVPESPFPIDAQPTVWVNDSYSAMQADDLERVARAAREIGLRPHWQALSRGGSDASCAASHGLIARPITLAFAAENSHGCEIMHRDSVENLSELTLAMLRECDKPAESPA